MEIQELADGLKVSGIRFPQPVGSLEVGYVIFRKLTRKETQILGHAGKLESAMENGIQQKLLDCDDRELSGYLSKSLERLQLLKQENTMRFYFSAIKDWNGGVPPTPIDLALESWSATLQDLDLCLMEEQVQDYLFRA